MKRCRGATASAAAAAVAKAKRWVSVATLVLLLPRHQERLRDAPRGSIFDGQSGAASAFQTPPLVGLLRRPQQRHHHYRHHYRSRPPSQVEACRGGWGGGGGGGRGAGGGGGAAVASWRPFRRRRARAEEDEGSIHRGGGRRYLYSTHGAGGGGGGGGWWTGERHGRSRSTAPSRASSALMEERGYRSAVVPLKSFPEGAKEKLLLELYFPEPDERLLFALDSISPDCIISREAAEALGIISSSPFILDPPPPTRKQRQQWQGDFVVNVGSRLNLPTVIMGNNANPSSLSVQLDALVAPEGYFERMGFSDPRVAGTLGLAFLDTFDLDLNFREEKAHVHLAGAVERGEITTSGESGLEAVECTVLPGGKLGVKMELNGGGPFTAVLDMSTNSTACNWAAARDLDVTRLLMKKPSRYPPETGRKLPLFKARFDTIQLGHVLLSGPPGLNGVEEEEEYMYDDDDDDEEEEEEEEVEEEERMDGGGRVVDDVDDRGGAAMRGAESEEESTWRVEKEEMGTGTDNETGLDSSSSSSSNSSSETETLAQRLRKQQQRQQRRQQQAPSHPSFYEQQRRKEKKDKGRLSIFVGHLPDFETLAVDVSGTPDPARPLAIVGLDLLSYRRIVLSCKSSKLYFRPRECHDMWGGQLVP